MIWVKLAGAAAALVYGALTAFRPKTPLYYQVLCFAMVSGFLGTCYHALALYLWPQAVQGFHVGYFGYIGMFFFLYSSYYGAINSLADGRERRYRPYRLAAGGLTALIGGAALWGIWTQADQRALLVLFLAPVAATAYFAAKHLILPDVEMGIIQAMRPLNAMVLELCLLQTAELSGILGDGGEAWAAAVCGSILTALCLPVARRGVGKWFI